MKSTPIKRTPVRKKRSGRPRRGRVFDPAFLDWMHETQVCLVMRVHCECQGWGTVHHVRENGSPKNDRRTLYLCQAHHLHDFGPESIERLGKKAFEKRHGINIEASIMEYNRAYDAAMQKGKP